MKDVELISDHMTKDLQRLKRTYKRDIINGVYDVHGTYAGYLRGYYAALRNTFTFICTFYGMPFNTHVFPPMLDENFLKPKPK